ncbi:hypothetical protein EI94DRAFT_1700079 [Lactarius quietus]|nr:hypothetical protein EI94DRAFT_1700079 [Lactarius quietus]
MCLHCLLPQQALAELHDTDIKVPMLLIDIHLAAQRATQGHIPGVMIIERHVLKWWFDPRSLDGRLDIATRYDLRIILFCHEGYTNSLAAAALQDIGLLNATDVVEGFEAWKAEGLPMELDASRPGMWRSMLGSVVLLELSRGPLATSAPLQAQAQATIIPREPKSEAAPTTCPDTVYTVYDKED